ncbi:DUF4157 domain-containing protein [Rhizobacter sp. SG703]|uniref:eCIS core domain-containing protein n=1 Tax=Rhizobacter sp. SG703 TaxID=2587140 RepID=UPI001444E9D6|nr:DUF4157 domain-containing protein [Rhizobacter sp. SG703]NKI96523.1 hypothetical protein [Rhizobacter sp. SG703]
MKVQLHANDRDGNSPSTAAHRPTADPFRDSPRMIAQRAQIDAAFGEAAQRAEDLGALEEEEEPMQAKADPGHGGLPAGLQAGIQALSGMDVSGVQVHRNSSQPAQLNALAYAQGNDIHLAPGQDHHLPHEAWHVVQQRQGRVEPTMQMAGVSINDDAGLEEEADRMGAQALQGAGLETDEP